jgi:hypothetical protein
MLGVHLEEVTQFGAGFTAPESRCNTTVPGGRDAASSADISTVPPG